MPIEPRIHPSRVRLLDFEEPVRAWIQEKMTARQDGLDRLVQQRPETLRQVSELLPYGIYTVPEVSCVGLSEEDAKAKGLDVVCGRAHYKNNARGKIIGDTDGMVKLVFDHSNRKLVGAHCIGDRATEIVHIGQAVILLGGVGVARSARRLRRGAGRTVHAAVRASLGQEVGDRMSKVPGVGDGGRLGPATPALRNSEEVS